MVNAAGTITVGRSRRCAGKFAVGGFSAGLAAEAAAWGIRVTTAARRIVDACHRGSPWLMLTLPARLGATLHDLAPATTIRLLALVSRLLPGPGGIGRHAVRGRERTSALSPSILTLADERAARRQNQAG